MGVLTWIFFGGAGIAGAVAMSLLNDEAKAWLPRLSRAVVRAAAQRAPASERLDRIEEWSADLEEWPGKLSQLWRALMILRGSRRLYPQSLLDREIAIQRHDSILLLGFACSSCLVATFGGPDELTRTWAYFVGSLASVLAPFSIRAWKRLLAMKEAGLTDEDVFGL